MTAPNDIPSFNFLDLKAFAQGTPYDGLAKLRRTTPVYWHPLVTQRKADDGFWLVMGHKDIVHIEKNPDIFSSHGGLTIADPPPRSMGPARAMILDGLTHLDPPEHTSHRQLVAPYFTPRAVRTLEPTIRATAVSIVERALERRTIDFATDIALRFPVTVVVGHVLGLPASEFHRIVDWSDFIAAPNDPSFPPWTGVRVVQELYDCGMAVIKTRRDAPGDDVLSELVRKNMKNGLPMSDDLFLQYFWSLLTGAFDTTASAIAGGMHALMSFPAEYEKLCADPSLIPRAVEEILRWVTPTIYFRRTAMSDVEFRGQPIRCGQRVVMCYASANRDEEVFLDPDVFNARRTRNDHLAFGHGEHFCLGASLARAEIRILFEELVTRRVHVELRGAIKRAHSNFQNRIKQMPVLMSA